MNRTTYQKILIENFLKGNKTHPSAYDIYKTLKRKMPTISLATIYNNLEKMALEGKILELNDGEKKRFDPNIEDHDHFLCIKCKNIYDIPKKIKKIKYKNFKVLSHTLYIKGVCDKCLKKEKEEKYE